MGDRLGQQLGNYRLVKLLGTGGFAEVYLGQHVHLASKQAAIKILHLLDVDAHEFQAEAETTEQLVHPHIVRLLDFALEQGTPFLVLDYAPGGSLRTRHPKGSIVPLATVEAYLNELAPALQYAHDQHILHRDIKPDNMLIGRQGELLLSDFGIAVLTLTGRTSLSSAYGIGGTPYYMAPETYQGRPVKESDQYALAVVVYEWLCGSVPFSEGNFIQLGYQHAHEPVPPLREKNPTLPPHVEAVIMKALAKEPKDRFASVQTFVKAFEQACIQARQAEQARLRQAEEQERARRAEEERLRQVEEERHRQDEEERARREKERADNIEEERVRKAMEAEQARKVEKERVRRVRQEPTPSHFPPSAGTRILQGFPLRFRSWKATILLLVLALLILGGGVGLYESVSRSSAMTQARATATAQAQANATATVEVQHHATATAQASIPGQIWHSQDSSTSKSLGGVAWSGSQFVVMGDNGTIFTSP
jgi:serine/threonine protein kinase